MLKDSMLKLFLINLVRDYLAYKNKKKCDKIYIKAKCVRACLQFVSCNLLALWIIHDGFNVLFKPHYMVIFYYRLALILSLSLYAPNRKLIL